ncbi:hypothetical protein AB0F17_57605 [Nonomuraea sp. NPDC026600]
MTDTLAFAPTPSPTPTLTPAEKPIPLLSMATHASPPTSAKT